ncbi:vacuolar iron transporter homolog 4-like [Prunus yedoensis var. nudiflora]|uniref:Vacuolar iron transporter n=1 Tax=Prunus yedoensis var. nudiflora TaxID=2094558 RepID=A0A314UN93_PRUYE|nr:vacuolar iron transporter homolog 4-like [Prunus yedoensis var. nudiflora]
MAPNSQTSFNEGKCAIPITTNDLEHQQTLDQNEFDYSKRSQWLRAAVLGANDGLISTASLMMGVGAVKEDIKAMILTGFAGLVAGACSMAIGEFVSVYSQLDIESGSNEKGQSEQAKTLAHVVEDGDSEGDNEKESLPNPLQAAAASALAFSVGAMVPLLAASLGSISCKLGFGGVWVVGAKLGKAPIMRSMMRVLFGGWMAMAITFGLTKLIGSSGCETP